MIPGLDIITAAGLLTLAATGGNIPACTVPKAPTISINATTQPIRYDYSRTQEQLGAIRSDTVNPYAPGTDTATGGLRQDAPQLSMNVRVGYRGVPGGPTCFWYDSVTVNIQLNPVIYIARENQGGDCGAAIMEHEKKHIAVDHRVSNSFAASVGDVVRKAVNEAGALGPYNADRIEETQKMMIDHIQSAVKSRQLSYETDMRRQQAQVDTLAEYERVSKICNKGKRR
jgi:hypothetical protein